MLVVVGVVVVMLASSTTPPATGKSISSTTTTASLVEIRVGICGLGRSSESSIDCGNRGGGEALMKR